ncbi:MAG: YncE family protein [Balneolaceae bacterium]
MKYHFLKILLAALFIFTGCNTQSDPDEVTLAGVYVLNEGNIGQANASITSYNPETGEVFQNVYESVNGVPIGDALQSATLIDGRLYLVVNNSHKIEVVEPETFLNIGTINIADEASPRYIAKAGENKAYVTNLYANTVSIINLESMEETGSIDVGANPEGIAVVGTKAFVANSGFGSGNTVSVINTETDTVKETISVGDNPVGVQADASGRVWVVCVGAYDDFNTESEDESTPGELFVLNGETGTEIEQIRVGGHPGELVLDSEFGKGYLSNGTVFQINTTTYEIENENFIRGFYALGLSTLDGEIFLWGADAGNFSQDGTAFQFDLSGAKIDSFSTGVIPGHFYFDFQ